VGRVLREGDAFGHCNVGADGKIMVEFVSANPTGPLHVGHGRQAALGDAISTLLEWQGWRVTREFYYNDAGNQIANLALSVQARVKQARGETVEMPKDGYLGDYIHDIARDYDNTRKWLTLTWSSDGPGSHYKAYSPRPNCN